MEQARILHCEDSEEWREVIASMLSVRGLHRVIAVAETLGETLQQLEAIKNGDLSINLVLLDGHLKGGQGLNHPRYVVSKMHELGVEVPVVGLSLDGLAEKGLRLDADIAADLLKNDVAGDPDYLARVLDALPELVEN